MEVKNKIYFTPLITGILLILLVILFQMLPLSQGDIGRLLLGTFSIILRVIIPFWINHLAKAQKRKSLFYVITSIIIPTIALITMGLLGDKRIMNNKTDSQ